VPFIAYFGDGIACPLSNDLMGMILSYIDEDAVNTIKKLNKVLRDMSHKDWHFVIHCQGYDYVTNQLIYDKDADYTSSLRNLRQEDIRIICWAVKYMPLIFSPDTRKKWDCWGQNGKHHIEHQTHGAELFKIRNPRPSRVYYTYVSIPKLENHYVPRMVALLSFMVSGFERVPENKCKNHKVCFKCREARWTNKLIMENLHLLNY